LGGEGHPAEAMIPESEPVLQEVRSFWQPIDPLLFMNYSVMSTEKLEGLQEGMVKWNRKRHF
jgi:hypothetical protein